MVSIQHALPNAPIWNDKLLPRPFSASAFLKLFQALNPVARHAKILGVAIGARGGYAPVSVARRRLTLRNRRSGKATRVTIASLHEYLSTLTMVSTRLMFPKRSRRAGAAFRKGPPQPVQHVSAPASDNFPNIRHNLVGPTS